ncbi:hypothetical protein SAMN03159474_01498 [Pseudomonas sp. NFACC08-1]|nr:hypothetical protein SAMN03159424_01366 [Pseudomonas sp. NFACC05-1]SDW76166.1 hypothetical protein SAMN03159474_01498 [Pseudomonas sp. NFACC08-1]
MMAGILWALPVGSKQGLGLPDGKRPMTQSELSLWRGSLLPLGCAATVRFRGRYAAQREQAPSPRALRQPFYSLLLP